MDYVLFLDDERAPPWWFGNAGDLIICRTAQAMIHTILELGAPMAISFDHDLGEAESGHDGLKALIELHLDGKLSLLPIQQVFVHSANPAGASNIAALWDNFSNTFMPVPVRAIKRAVK